MSATLVKKRDSYRIFDGIASRYDFINSVLSFGLHKFWRGQMTKLLPDRKELRGLDLATGTGDVAIAFANEDHVKHVQGIDLSLGMIGKGMEKISQLGLSKNVELQHGDAQKLAIADAQFDFATMAFGIRNVGDVSVCLQEIHRVLKPGGRVIIMEFGLPESQLMRRLHLFYLRRVLPIIGRLLSGHSYAYRYLNETIETFPYGQQFCHLLTKASFQNTRFQVLTAGIVNIYWGDKGDRV